MLILRNMLGDDFKPSVQNCAPTADAAAIARCESMMRAYYPEAAECAVAIFVKGGTSACFPEYRRQR